MPFCAPVAGKIRVSGSAQAPSVPLNISPLVVLRTPCADCIGVPRGCWLGAFAGRVYLRLLDRPVKFHESRRTIKAFSQTGAGAPPLPVAE